MGALVLQPRDTRANAADVIGDDEQRVLRIGVRPVVGRDVVDGVSRQELQPVVEPPGVEQGGFLVEKILDLLTRHLLRFAHV